VLNLDNNLFLGKKPRYRSKQQEILSGLQHQRPEQGLFDTKSGLNSLIFAAFKAKNTRCHIE
jgi:hypothetical protein